MNGEIILTQPSYFVALCALAGILVAALLYFGEKELPKATRLGLGLLRAIAVGLIAFLILGPLLRNVDTRTQKPVFIIAEDQSSSVKGTVDSLAPQLDQLSAAIAEKYDVQRVGLGERIRSLPDTTVDQATDLAQLFTYAKDNYPPELLGGILLVSDGIYNQGSDPSYASAGLTAPVYAVPLGDTTPARDVTIADALYNRIAYLGDKLELQVDVQATNLSGSSTTITVSEVSTNGRTKQLDTKTLPIASKRSFQTVRFLVEPKRAGVARYVVQASGPRDERNKVNNRRSISVDVLDARQQVLILAAAPHPDISALRQSLEGNKNYETSFALLQNLADEVKDADLVIFHNLPAAGKDISAVLKQLDKRKVGRLFIAGKNTDMTALNSAQGLFSIKAKGTQVNEVTPKLNGAFTLFTLNEEWNQTIKSWPPAVAPFAEYSALSTGDVLLTQRIGRVDTDFPLLAAGEVNGSKVGVFSGQGLWRWRLAEYQQNQSQEVFDGLISSLVQYLALREDKRPFRVTAAERLYTTSEDITLQGELYNASYQLVNSPDVNLRITNSDGTAYPFLMDKVGSSYRLSVGRLPEGRYEFRASTSYNGEAYSSKGSFNVEARQLESIVTTADWNLLQRISDQQGGKLVLPNAIASLTEDLLADNLAKPVLYQSVRTRPLIDWPWLLAIALGLLTIEWYLRRRLGSY
ncbi:MAG: hypothetical protein AB8F78_01670 [Saprospiraceae bacterium]